MPIAEEAPDWLVSAPFVCHGAHFTVLRPIELSIFTPAPAADDDTFEITRCASARQQRFYRRFYGWRGLRFQGLPPDTYSDK